MIIIRLFLDLICGVSFDFNFYISILLIIQVLRLILSSEEQVFAAAAAVARSLPQYTRKTGSKVKGSLTVQVAVKSANPEQAIWNVDYKTLQLTGVWSCFFVIINLKRL
jgi:hypothetical protein